MCNREFRPFISLSIIDRERYMLLRKAGFSDSKNILREGKPLRPDSEATGHGKYLRA